MSFLDELKKEQERVKEEQKTTGQRVYVQGTATGGKVQGTSSSRNPLNLASPQSGNAQAQGSLLLSPTGNSPLGSPSNPLIDTLDTATQSAARTPDQIQADISAAQKELDLYTKTTFPFGLFESDWHKKAKDTAQGKVDALKDEWKNTVGYEYGAYDDNTPGITKAINKALDFGDAAATSGVSQFTTGVANTADLLVGKPLAAAGWKNNPLSTGAEIMNRYNDELSQELMNTAGNNKAARTAATVLSGAVAAAPMAVMAFLTGGATAATTGTLQATAASQGMTAAQNVGRQAAQMMKNPNYWTSFLQEAGNNYREAKEWTNDDTKAAMYAVTVGLINSGIEIGLDGASGIQGLEQSVRQGNTAGLRNLISSAGGEAMEELEQGVVSRGVGQLFGSGAPTFSTTDPNAVINPQTMASEAAMGGAVGALLIGGTYGINSAAQRAYSNPLIDTYENAQTSPAPQAEQQEPTQPIQTHTEQAQLPAAPVQQAETQIQDDTPTNTPTAPAQTNPAVGQSAPAVSQPSAPSQLNIVDNTANGMYNTAMNGGAENAGPDTAGQLYGTSGEGVRARQHGPETDSEMAVRGQFGRRDLHNSGIVLLSPESVQALENRGVVNVALQESTSDSAAFSSALDAARQSDTRNGWAVSPHTPEELQSMNVRTYMGPNNSSGFGITPDGDIVAVFSNRTAGAPKGVTKSLIPQAVALGGTKLDCYGEKLVDIYSGFGFIPVARVTFDPSVANPGWDESKGRPYVYFMMHNGDSADTIVQNMGNYKTWSRAELEALPLMDYDAAGEYRNSLLAQRNSQTPPSVPPNSLIETMTNAQPQNPLLDTAFPEQSNPQNPQNIGAAQQGFTTPTRGQTVYTQNETMTHGADLTDEERERYTPGVHEQVTAEMSRERDEGLFYQDENGNMTNLEDTVAGLLEKEAWTGVEQDAAQMVFRQMKDNLRDMTSEQYASFQALARAIEEIGGTEAGRSLQARQKWVDSGDGIMSESMYILDDPRIDPRTARDVMERIRELSQGFDQAGRAENIDDYFRIIREAAVDRRTSRGTSEQIKRTAEWAMEQIRSYNDMEFARSAARSSIVAMAEDRVPRSMSSQLLAFRRDAMLSKISTWMRNVVSNNVFDPIDSIARDISVPLDIALSRLTGTRSTAADLSWLSAAKRDGARYGAARAFLECALDISAEGATSRYDQAGNRTFKTTGNVFQRFMSQWEKVSNYAMYSTDQMQKGGIDAEVQRGTDRLYDRDLIRDDSLRNAGEQEATFRTFQEDSRLAGGLSKIRRGLNDVAHVGEMGLGDILMPFVQVPANLVDITIDYSPLGIARGIYRLTDTLIDARRGTMTAAQQARAIQTIGRSLTGTGVLALAVLAKMAGALIISDDGREEDKDKTALESQANLSGTQLNLSGIMRLFRRQSAEYQYGDFLMSIGFMDPLNALLNMGGLIADDYLAEHEGEENGITLGEIMNDALAGTVQAVKDLPMMDPIFEMFDAYNYSKADTTGGRMTDAALQYAAGQVTSLIPNNIKGIAQGTDTMQRDKYTSNNLLGRTWDDIRASIPGLRQTLPVKQDSFGQEMDSGNPALNFLNNNILPGAIVQYRPRNETIENWLDYLFEATGSVTMYPDKNPPNSISKDTDGDGKAEKFELTAEDKRQYKTTYGNILIDLYDQMLNSQGTITPEELVDIASDLKSYAGNQAKQDYFDTHGINAEASTNSVNKAVQALEDGITVGQYYQLKQRHDEIDKGPGSATDKMTAWTHYLDSQDLTSKQVAKMTELMGYSTIMPVHEAEHYLGLKENGLSSDKAEKIYNAVSAKEPDPGKTQISDDQRADAILSVKGLTVREQLSALKEYYKAETKQSLYQKYEDAYNQAGISPEVYCRYRQDKDSYPYEINEKTGSRKVKEGVIDLINSMDLTKEQKQWLFDLEGYKGTVKWS